MNTVFLFYTVCPGSSTPFYIVIYYIKWVTTSWTYSRESIHLLYTKCSPPPHHIKQSYTKDTADERASRHPEEDLPVETHGLSLANRQAPRLRGERPGADSAPAPAHSPVRAARAARTRAAACSAVGAVRLFLHARSMASASRQSGSASRMSFCTF